MDFIKFKGSYQISLKSVEIKENLVIEETEGGSLKKSSFLSRACRLTIAFVIAVDDHHQGFLFGAKRDSVSHKRIACKYWVQRHAGMKVSQLPSVPLLAV